MTENVLSLEMIRISKSFPGVKALDSVSFSVSRGRVHAIVGENGAGKSTLMKILSGVLQPDAGTIRIDGSEVNFRNTNHAKAGGVSLIHQEFNLVNSLSVAENIFLGFLPTNSFGVVNWKKTRQKASELMDRLGFALSVEKKVLDLSVAERQLVEIAKALSVDAKIIAMDEPTSSLTGKEIEKLFNIVDMLRRSGITVIYISHKLDEVFELCDAITVLRDGRVVDTRRSNETKRSEVISMMVGRPVETTYPPRSHIVGDEVVLETRNLVSGGVVKGVSFGLRKGEILGIAGLVGSGRTELAECLFGARHVDSGEIYVKGKRAKIRSTGDGISLSIGLVTEDRKETGLALQYSVTENTIITDLARVSRLGFVNSSKCNQGTQRFVKNLGIRTPSIDQKVVFLSGGNQQKVVLAKWLFADVDILILDEPTRGIDVGAKYEIYLLMNQLASQGRSIIMISSELPEVLGMSDRLLVMGAGELKGELQRSDFSPEAVMRIALT